MPNWYLLGAVSTGMGESWSYRKTFGRTCLMALISSSMTDWSSQERCGRIFKSARWTRTREFRSTEHLWIRFFHGCVSLPARWTANLFLVADIQDVGYWVAKIQSEVVVHPFIVAYGYRENIEKLIRLYRTKESPYKNWVFPINLEFARGKHKNESRAQGDAERAAQQQHAADGASRRS